MTLVRLEEIAQDLQEGQQKPSLFPSDVLEARPVSLHFFPAGNETPSRLVEPGDSFDDPGMLMVLTRLTPPPLPAALVERERLLSALEAALSCPLPLLYFLLQTSVLHQLSVSLCNAIRGREDSDRLLEQVERANLFLQPLDESRQWYRYHALWAQAMQHEARRRLGTAAVHSQSCKAS